MLGFGSVDSPQTEVLSAAGEQLILAATSVRGVHVAFVVLVSAKSTTARLTFSLSTSVYPFKYASKQTLVS